MSAIWPSAVATDANLYVAKNSLQTTLATAINSSDTSIVLASATSFPAAGGVTIDNEVIFYTGVSGATLTGCTRGADGTTAASHSVGVPVGASIIAFHHNGLMAEVEAIESYLDTVLGKGTTVTATEFAYVHGVTSAIQTQMDLKAPKASPQFSGTVGIGAAGSVYNLRVKGGNTNQVLIDNDGSQYTELDFANNGTAKFPMYWDNTNSNFQMGNGTGTITFANQFLGKDGSAGAPGVSLTSLPTAGMFKNGTNLAFASAGAGVFQITSTGQLSPFNDGTQNLGSGSAHWGNFYATEVFLATALSDATTYTVEILSSGGGTATNAGDTGLQSTTSVSTGGSTIFSMTNESYLVNVVGSDGTNVFNDLILVNYYSTAPAPTVIASRNVLASPTARTYSVPSNGSLKLVMASGTYAIRVRADGLSRR